MRKSIFWLLLAATAATPVAAQGPASTGSGERIQTAQRGENGGPRSGWRGQRGGGEMRGESRGGGEFRGNRGGFDRGQRDAGAGAERPARSVNGAIWQGRQRVEQARDRATFERPDRGQRPDGGQWRGNRQGDGERGSPGWRRDGQDSRPGGWRGNPDARGDRGDWNRRPDGARPGVTPDPNWNRDGARDGRDWTRGRDGVRDGRDWNRDGRDRNWDRGNRDRNWNGNRDWNRDRNWNRDNRGWDNRNWGNRGWDRGGGWNRDWRRDGRYDWQRYRFANRSIFRPGRYYAPRGWGRGYQRFGIGLTIGAPLFASNYWINDPWSYRLPPVDGPYRWVRYYDDVLLIDIRSGNVVDVIHDFFW